MGTTTSLQHKFLIVDRIINQCKKEKRIIIRDPMISMIMRECFCGKAKAIELLIAILPRYNYKEFREGKEVQYISVKNKLMPKASLTKEEQEVLK